VNLDQSINLYCTGNENSGCDPKIAESHGTKCGRPKGSGEEEKKYSRYVEHTPEVIEKRLKEVGKEMSVSDFVKMPGARMAASAVITPDGRLVFLSSYHDNTFIDITTHKVLEQGYVRVANFGGGRSIGFEAKGNRLTKDQETVMFELIDHIKDKDKVMFDFEHLRNEKFASGRGVNNLLDALGKVFPPGHDYEPPETDEFGQPL